MVYLAATVATAAVAEALYGILLIAHGELLDMEERVIYPQGMEEEAETAGEDLVELLFLAHQI